MALEQLTLLPAPQQFLPFLRERRQVSKDGYISYDGVLYGVPWRFSGREVYVREIRDTVEIWTDGKLIASHQKQSQSRTIVSYPNQYARLTAANGYIVPKLVARQIPSYEVEARLPGWYDQLMEVVKS